MMRSPTSIPAALALVLVSSAAASSAQTMDDETPPDEDLAATGGALDTGTVTADDTAADAYDDSEDDEDYDEDEELVADELFQFGLRLGYGIPLGESVKGIDLTEGIVGMIPVWGDFFFKITPGLYAGIYAQYGFVIPEAPEDGGCRDCSMASIRFGAQLAYHFSPTSGSADPWVGYGLGYEIARTSSRGDTASTEGLELANLQAGVDFGAPRGVPIGLFASYSMGRYSKLKLQGKSEDIPKKGTHTWLVLGVRGGVDL